MLDDLPPRAEIVLHVELSRAEAALYEALRRRAVEDLEALTAQGSGATPAAGEGRLEVLAHLTRLRLACCNPRLVQDAGAPASSKLATFAETLEELLANRHKVLVFSQFVRHLKLIEEQIVALHHHQRDLAERLLEGADAPARLDAAELLELLRKPLA